MAKGENKKNGSSSQKGKTVKNTKKNTKTVTRRLKHPEDRNPYRFVWISLILLSAAIYLIISEISYFSNWKVDASIVSQPLGTISHDMVLNSCGHFGAKCADYLTRELFGFAAILIPIPIILYSLFIAHLPKIRVGKKICPSVIIFCYVSVFMGSFFGRNDAFFGSGAGGEMGIYVAEWIKGYIGEQGTAILLIVLMALLLWSLLNSMVMWILGKIISVISALINQISVQYRKRREARMERMTSLPDLYPETEISALDDIPTEQPIEQPTEQPLERPQEQPLEQLEDKIEEKAVPEDIEPAIETFQLENGQLAAIITEDFLLYLDIDAYKQMERDGKFSYVNTEEEIQKEEEEIFTITHVENKQEIAEKTFKTTAETAAETTAETAAETAAETIAETIAETADTDIIAENNKDEEFKELTENKTDKTVSIQVDDLVISKTDSEERVSDEDVNERTLYDPTYELKNYHKPTIDLLNKYDEGNILVKNDEVIKNKNQIVETLSTFGINISEIEATVGPTVTLYEIKPAPGVRISKIQNLEKDIALSLAALGIRIIAPIPGKGAIGIEVPNRNKSTVSMYSVIKSAKFHESKAELPIALGKTIQNETLVLDLAKMPHLLVAGATGQGKSVGLNAIITSLLYKKHPAELKFVMVDPKRLELTPYSALANHFMAQMEGSDNIILTETEKVIFTLNSICKEMDDRYKLLEDAGVKNLKEYNEKFIHRRLNPEKGHRFLPYLVVIVDEFADLIMTAGREIETPIARIAQLARAAGIHMIIATQRPTTNIITGTIKANFPARIAFRVTSYIDSKTILDKAGADQLIGRGDMLVQSGSDLIRVQCAFVDTPEVEAITQFIGAQHGYSTPYQLPEYQPESDSKEMSSQSSGPMQVDPLLVEVARYVVDNQNGSTSKIQRNFEIGFNRAGRIVDQLENLGIVGKQSGSKPRQVLITDPVYLEHILDSIR